MEPKRTELLAPAGNESSLHAAVTAGADAVYLGTGAFNARRGAANFSLEALGQACDYAHLRGVKVYLTLNTVILQSEMHDALETARQAYRQGVDAFIIQDIGLASEVRRILPDAPLHISTQMNTHSVPGLEAAAGLGAKRVTLARELSLDRIGCLSTHARGLGIELEAFAHGALCLCYSGQCYMSSMIGGRSANRGLCAQPCRLPYALHNKALRKPCPAQGEHLLSPKDLCTIDLIPQLFEQGVVSFKIEGRMKSPEYVYAVTSVYRRVLDSVEDGRFEPASEKEKLVLAEVFSRGFTAEYLEGRRGNEMMSYGRPNNRGVFVGRVVSARDGKVAVAFEEDVTVGDLLEFWTNKGHFTYEVEGLDFDSKGHCIFILTRPVGKGDRVFRVRSAKAAFHDDPFSPAIPVKGKIDLVLGSPVKIIFSLEATNLSAQAADGEESTQISAAGIGGEETVQVKAGGGEERDNSVASAHGDQPSAVTRNGMGERPDSSPDALGSSLLTVSVEGDIVEAARTKAVTQEEVHEHIDRFGNTPFCLETLDIILDEGVGIGFSQLHRLRAEALDRLSDALLAPYRERVLAKIPESVNMPAARKTGCLIASWASNPACARAAKRAGADLIYVPALSYKRGQALIAGQVSETAESAGYPKQSIIALPVVDSATFDPWQYVRPGKPVLAENLGQLMAAPSFEATPEVGPHIPLLNRPALQMAARLGASRVWLSPELSLAQIEELATDSPVPLGLTLIGYQELMTTEHCLLMSQGPCNESCEGCQRRKSPHYLKDRKGYEFPVVTDFCGRSHVYNAVEFDIAHAAPDLIRAGVQAFMVDTTMMNVAETTKAVERAVRARDIALKSGDKVSKKEGATTGHLFRGLA